MRGTFESVRHVRFGRMAAVLLPSAGAVIGIMGGIAQGAIPVSFAVGGNIFKISSTDFKGYGYQQYMGEVKQQNGTVQPVATTVFGRATLDHLCQTATLRVPVIGNVILAIYAGDQGTPAAATNLVVQASNQKGLAIFHQMKIGIDASALTHERQLAGQPGYVALEADDFEMQGLQQDTWQVTAATFTLPNLRLGMTTSGHECY